ncbi:hypothetical protein CWE15_08895 [Aliidiomarina taiwanensis]|uniref:DUF6794 domain-containing protein n=1 Tax=Aliidiomarina taiwanensis TaxID=946228 RepID=A0A432X142_9GAMM|nr:DUF6794 domain-containing protein [Aliidiomarina taiwanensis]RUO39858.1 hypothetical protein CWE15_08895 [Aliidiomarina taiwanensis]
MYKLLLTVFICLVLSSCSSVPESSAESQTDTKASRTCKETALDIYKNLDQESINTLQETEKEDLIQFHFGWGMGIRNSYGLWSEDSPVRKSCAAMSGEQDMHPDSASSVIMELVWELVHDSM